MKFILFCHRSEIIQRMSAALKNSEFEMIVISTANALFEEMDLENVSTIIIDMHHVEARDVLRELNIRKITEILPVLAMFKLSDQDQDIAFAKAHGATFYFSQLFNSGELPAYLSRFRRPK